VRRGTKYKSLCDERQVTDEPALPPVKWLTDRPVFPSQARSAARTSDNASPTPRTLDQRHRRPGSDLPMRLLCITWQLDFVASTDRESPRQSPDADLSGIHGLIRSCRDVDGVC
jgi:hypothetical protein